MTTLDYVFFLFWFFLLIVRLLAPLASHYLWIQSLLKTSDSTPCVRQKLTWANNYLPQSHISGFLPNSISIKTSYRPTLLPASSILRSRINTFPLAPLTLSIFIAHASMYRVQLAGNLQLHGNAPFWLNALSRVFDAGD